MPKIAELRLRHRHRRATQPESLRVRVHRAISWLTAAERISGDPDAEFLFLWIAFNAAYASEFGFEHGEREQTRAFVERIVDLDREGRLQDALFRQFTGPVRTLIENRFVFAPYWRALRDHDGSGAWEEKFAKARKLALQALLEKRTAVLLSIVLDRLHVLRNQLVHGGATCGSSANRAQLNDGVQILRVIVPVVVALLVELEDDPFGAVAYPYVHD
ncbi:HEPN domain-containing protein [Arenimonas composti]|uniref:Uncharacterized protein n=1 Tax=Arenimonas composti TR7-09 = DSM 18010 TaxID=1121013 RepID=A0A091BAR1_9GAMM|nr:HEPN domain-containing protein [Arenimonas composti]KFN48826.1 hypothetical protein P873_13520 [Arenimonas composti TR7-09 = DSM 18010]